MMIPSQTLTGMISETPLKTKYATLRKSRSPLLEADTKHTDRGALDTGAASTGREKMLVRVSDLCGREEPYEIDTCDLDRAVAGTLYELSCEADGPWFIGEYQYDELRSSLAT